MVRKWSPKIQKIINLPFGILMKYPGLKQYNAGINMKRDFTDFHI